MDYEMFGELHKFWRDQAEQRRDVLTGSKCIINASRYNLSKSNEECEIDFISATWELLFLFDHVILIVGDFTLFDYFSRWMSRKVFNQLVISNRINFIFKSPIHFGVSYNSSAKTAKESISIVRTEIPSQETVVLSDGPSKDLNAELNKHPHWKRILRLFRTEQEFDMWKLSLDNIDDNIETEITENDSWNIASNKSLFAGAKLLDCERVNLTKILSYFESKFASDFFGCSLCISINGFDQVANSIDENYMQVVNILDLTRIPVSSDFFTSKKNDYNCLFELLSKQSFVDFRDAIKKGFKNGKFIDASTLVQKLEKEASFNFLLATGKIAAYNGVSLIPVFGPILSAGVNVAEISLKAQSKRKNFSYLLPKIRSDLSSIMLP